MTFKPGDRVKVSPHVWWPEGAIGIVRNAPQSVNDILSETGDVEFDQSQRTVKGRNSIITTIWVDFDTPVRDSDGDGPYRAGEVEMEFLEHLSPDI